MNERDFSRKLKENLSDLTLKEGTKVGVIGGGPSGSLFSYFLIELARRVGININVDIYEMQDFSNFGPLGCNYCGGIVSESLVQILSSEGITIPENVVQRGIDSYMLHMDVGSAKIETPLQEKRIAAMYRGGGPRGSTKMEWGSFDGFLLNLTKKKGSNIIYEKVESIEFNQGRPFVTTKHGKSKEYDLIVGAVGVNTPSLKLFENLDIEFKPPETTRAFISEFNLERKVVLKYFGNAMHVFLLNIPGLEFAAIIPKGDYVTLVMLGDKINKKLIENFLDNDKVKNCFPPDLDLVNGYPCKCMPKINLKPAVQPFSDRVVLIGDCSVTKLYKNGIGAAYVAAKAAANTVVFKGFSKRDFEEHYWPICKSINKDNNIGKFIFLASQVVRKMDFTKRSILRLVSKEQSKEGGKRIMSGILWDTFTGSAPYKDIFRRAFNPSFISNFVWEIVLSIFKIKARKSKPITATKAGTLGKLYKNGENIAVQGEMGDCMYVIQKGEVEIVTFKDGKEVVLATLKEGEFFGEMSLFENMVRSTTVRAVGETRTLTVDKGTFLHRIQEDPSMAFHIVQLMSTRIRDLNVQLGRIRGDDRRNWMTRPENLDI